MDIASLLITLISGAVGGNVAGAVSKDNNMGTIANTVSGLIGGGLGDFLLKAAGVIGTAAASSATGAPTGHELDISSLLANIGISGVSGGVLTAIITFIKAAMDKK